MLTLYDDGRRLSLEAPGDAASQERMLGLVDTPTTTLNEVHLQVEHTLWRMSRTRKIVVHGARASGQGLEVVVRTAAHLVGAVLDRVVHA